MIRRDFQLVQQKGADDAQRIGFGEKCQRVRPCVQIDAAVIAGKDQLPSLFFAFEQSEGGVFLQLLSDCGDVRLPVTVEAAQIFFGKQVENLRRGVGAAAAEQIENVKVEDHVTGGKAFRLECVVEGVSGNGAAVHRQEQIFSVRRLTEAHIVTQPAFDAAAFVVIASRALLVVFIPVFEAIDVELPEIVPNPVEVFDQLAVCHTAPPPL